MNTQEALRFLLDEMGDPLYNYSRRASEPARAHIGSFGIDVKKLNEARQLAGLPVVGEETDS